MLFQAWKRFGTCIKRRLCFDSGQEDCVWTKKLNLPGSILWHLGYGQPMMKSYSSYPPKEGDHIQSYGIYLPCDAGESAKLVPRTCLITEQQRQLKSTVWVASWHCLICWWRGQRGVFDYLSLVVFIEGSALQLMHLTCLETHFVLSLLKTFLWFCLKMTHMLFPSLLLGGKN